MNLSAEVIAVPAAFATLWGLEYRKPARPFVEQKGSALRGLVFFALTAIVGMIVPAAWALTPLGHAHLVHVQLLDSAWGVIIGFVVVTFANYWWHRAEHRFHRLWLLTHQLHHSALRVDVASAFFVHPLEVAVKTTLAFLVSRFALGLTVEVSAIIVTITSVLSIIEHVNVKTPRWLGFLIARPEMHCLHHEFGVHARNYGLPLWDLLFGTFENPSEVNLRVGFEPAASARLADLLLGRDVNAQDPVPVTNGQPDPVLRLDRRS